MPKYDVISFLSDMGTADESVGVCKAIIFQQAPHVNIFDITHDVPAFDIRAGALALTRAIQFLPTGIVIAAVDPGAPRDQRYIAVEMEEGVLIGPDNGILAPASQLIGQPKRVVQISNADYRIEAPGDVFAARDILAPAAGLVASGTDVGELGPEIPLEQLVPGMLQLSRHDEGGAFLGEVWSLDRFGNVQLNITPEELSEKNVKVGDTVSIRVGENDHMAKFVERYADLAIAQLGILVDSTGMISIVKNLDFAARELEVKEGKAVAILPQGATITGRDVTAETVRADQESAILGDQVPELTQDVQPMSPIADNPMAQNPAPNNQIAQGQSQPLPSPVPMPVTSLESFGTVPPNPVDQYASTKTPEAPVSVPAHQFVEREFESEPGLPPDPFATAPISPPIEPPVTSDPFASAPLSPPVVPDPFASAPVAPNPVQPEAPASYFPPPVVEQPAVKAPEVAPVYSQSPAEQPPVEEDPTLPAGVLPENVFDLFKGPDSDEQDSNNSDSDQQPRQ